MKGIVVVFLGIIATMVLLIIGGIMVGIGINNSAVTMEKQIEYQYKQNQNNRSKMVNQIAEAAQVPSMYKNDFKEIISASMEGRYGKNGSKAAFQWLQEHQINFDSTLYAKLQTMIESSRSEFAIEQEKLLDKKRMYETKLNTQPTGLILSIFGFPKIDLDKYKIIVSEDNEKVFNKGVESPLQMR